MQLDSANKLLGLVEVHIACSCDPVDLSANFETSATDRTTGAVTAITLNPLEPCTSRNINRTFTLAPIDGEFHAGDTVTVTTTLTPSQTGSTGATVTRTLVLG
ncbi:hypothetical protein [Kitasatospora sp. HPMI-4]|uniref:hypothetical protein n=1 Tax=Kitasatospora sp. HPMI-4 TaxID=3448443 RepID=UPI003F194195